MSSIGTGAVILTNPDAPLNLANDPAVTLATQIGLTWTIGVNEGGSPVIDYQVTYLDPHVGVQHTPLKSSHETSMDLVPTQAKY